MKYQIKNISGHQTSKIFAIAFAIMTLPFAAIGIFGFVFGAPMEDQHGNSVSFPWLFFAAAPLIYGGMAYVMNRFMIWAYNLIAKRFGGIEFTLKETNDS